MTGGDGRPARPPCDRPSSLFAPVSLRTDRARIRRTVHDALSAESGFWKMICIARLSSVLRLEIVPASSCWSSVSSAAGVGRVHTEDRLRQRRSCPSPTRRPGPGSRRRPATGRRRPARARRDPSDGTSSRRRRSTGSSVPDDDSPVIGPGIFVELGDLVVVMAAGEVTAADLDQLRRHLAADVGDQRAAVDEHAGGQIGSERRQRAGNGDQGVLRLAHAAARERVQQPDRVGVLRSSRTPRRPRPPRRSCRRTSRRPGRTSNGSRRGCGRSSGWPRPSRCAACARGRAPRLRPWRRDRWSARRAPAASDRRPAPSR